LCSLDLPCNGEVGTDGLSGDGVGNSALSLSLDLVSEDDRPGLAGGVGSILSVRGAGVDAFVDILVDEALNVEASLETTEDFELDGLSDVFLEGSFLGSGGDFGSCPKVGGVDSLRVVLGVTGLPV
jgi:hypothetical protein